MTYISNDITELEDKIEHIENTYQPIGLVTLYVKFLKKDLKSLRAQEKKNTGNNGTV